MTDMYDPKKVPDFSLPPYPHEEHTPGVGVSVAPYRVSYKCCLQQVSRNGVKHHFNASFLAVQDSALKKIMSLKNHHLLFIKIILVQIWLGLSVLR